MPLACEECDRVTDDARGWIAKVVEDDDELDTHLCVVLYCPICAEREFDCSYGPLSLGRSPAIVLALLKKSVHESLDEGSESQRRIERLPCCL